MPENTSSTNNKPTSLSSKEKADLIREFADDIKAERIEILDVREKTSVTDYFVVCTGNSDVHVRSIVGKVEERLLPYKVKPLRTEDGNSGWVLQDYGDVVFHVLLEEKRQFYDLETLWNEMKPNPDLAQ